MKNLQRFCTASVLVLALTLPAFAGWMDTGVAPPPPPAPTSATTQGGMETGVGGQTTASDSIAEIALSLLGSILPLF